MLPTLEDVQILSNLLEDVDNWIDVQIALEDVSKTKWDYSDATYYDSFILDEDFIYDDQLVKNYNETWSFPRLIFLFKTASKLFVPQWKRRCNYTVKMVVFDE